MAAIFKVFVALKIADKGLTTSLTKKLTDKIEANSPDLCHFSPKTSEKMDSPKKNKIRQTGKPMAKSVIADFLKKEKAWAFCSFITKDATFWKKTSRYEIPIKPKGALKTM